MDTNTAAIMKNPLPTTAVLCSLSTFGVSRRLRWTKWRADLRQNPSYFANSNSMSNQEQTAFPETRRNPRVESRQPAILLVDGAQLRGYTSIVSSQGATIYLDAAPETLTSLKAGLQIEARISLSEFLPAEINSVWTDSENPNQPKLVIGLKLLDGYTWLKKA